ncbi:MAG: hypothetical protein A2Y10_01670 [Planctomycetes bacterium GWF2_41_51]|nr:MAG: hypothetical protein A2Y10_01670 [Planctomycetes bacterium GWF2_41_51]
MRKTDLVAYCGLYCAICPGYTQVPADLAKELKTALAKGKFEKVSDFLAKMPAFEGFKFYKQGIELLNSIAKLRCKGCQQGGGSSECKIRICAKQKKYKGCWECGESESCDKFTVMLEDNEKTYQKNLKKIKRNGLEKFVKTKSKKIKA